MLAADICTDLHQMYGAVPPAADAAIWWAYAAAVTLAVFDGILYWAYTSCWGGWFWDLCCVLGYMDVHIKQECVVLINLLFLLVQRQEDLSGICSQTHYDVICIYHKLPFTLISSSDSYVGDNYDKCDIITLI